MSKKPVTQDNRVEQYIHEHGSITSLEAIRELGVTRLASVINRMKKAGAPIQVERVEVINRYGEHTHVARYSFYEEEKDG